MSNETELNVEKVTKIQNLDEVVVCDNNHTFLANTALLIPFVNQADDLGNIMYLDIEYRLKLGTNYRQQEIHGYLLACPICKVIHLSGFNAALTFNQVMSGMDNTVAERNLSPEL